MAPVLLCPECGARHPLDGVGGSAFPCNGCGRMLKVPQQVPVPAASSGGAPVAAAPGVDPDLPWPAAPGADPTSTRVLSTSPPPPGPAPQAAPAPPKPRRAAKLDPVPARWIRFAIWIVAVPLGFVIVFAFARAVGTLNSNQLQDVVITDGWRRFMPLARLLPFVALVTAGLVQGAVYGVTRLRERRAAPPGPGRAPQRKAA